MNFGLNLLMGMMSGSSSGYSGDPITIPAFQISRSSTVAIDKNTDFDVQITATRTAGSAPLGVAFNAIDNSTYYGIARPHHQLSFTWFFDDAGAVYKNISTDNRFGNSSNTEIGFCTGHVFPIGVFTVKLFVYDHLTGKVGYAEKVISTSDADTYFSGTKTICWSEAGDYTAAPVGADVTATSLLDALTKLDDPADGDRRLLLRAGETYDSLLTVFQPKRAGNRHISKYDTGANPVIKPNVLWDKATTRLIAPKVTSGPMTFYDLDFESDFDPVGGTGELERITCITNDGADNMTVYHCSSNGMSRLFAAGIPVGNGGNIVIDNFCTNWQNFAVAGEYKNGAIIGNNLQQNSSAVSGVGAKDISRFYEAGNGIKTVFTHGMDTYGYTDKNIYVGLRDDTTYIVTEQTKTTDFTYTVKAAGDLSGEVTFLAAPPTGETVVIYSRKWAVHGPIRTYSAFSLSTSHNKLLSKTGWSTGGAPAGEGAHQPCIRDNSATGFNLGAGAASCINMNTCTGGISNIANTNDSDGASGVVLKNDCIIEQNYCVADSHTSYPIYVNAGTTIRNNIIIVPDMVKSTAYTYVKALVGCVAYDFQDAVDSDAQVTVDNNTVIILSTAANSASDLDGIAVLSTTNLAHGIEPPNKSVSNNLVHYPEFTPPRADYSPINTVTGELQVGSSAINTGASIPSYVWDDHFGIVRDGTPSLGASEVAQVAAQTLTLNGTSSYIDFDTNYIFSAGDTFQITYAANLQTATNYIADRGWGTAGTPLLLRAATANRLYWSTANADVTLDATTQTAGTQIPANFDNTDKVLVATAIGSGFAVARLGSSTLSGDFFSGVIKNVIITIGGVSTTFNLDSGALDGATEESVEGGKFVTLHNPVWA